MTAEPDPPMGVRIVYIDGSMRGLTALYYVGYEDGMHIWEAVDPEPEKIAKGVEVDIMPPYTTVTVRR